MLSLRIASRALPKAAFRQPVLRGTTAVSRFASHRPARHPNLQSSYPAFSTSVARREPAGDSDAELIAMLNRERNLEEQESESANTTSRAAAINEFVENSPFRIQDQPGHHEIVLTRDFGNEKITVKLSVSDIAEYPPEEEYDDDEAFDDVALEDEADFGQKRAINQPGGAAGKIATAPEDSIAPADREDGEEEQDVSPAAPAHLTITIAKPGKTALEIQATADDGAIEIDSVVFFPKASLLEAQTSKESQEARSVYAGPAINSLDPELQQMLITYLEERGINSGLANFLPEYVEYKEQQEYVRWLENLENFIKE